MKKINATKLIRLSLIPHGALFLLGCFLGINFLGIISSDNWVIYFTIILLFKVYFILFINFRFNKILTYRMNNDMKLMNWIKGINIAPLSLFFLLVVNLIFKSSLIEEWIFPGIIFLEIIYSFLIVKAFRRRAFLNIYL